MKAMTSEAAVPGTTVTTAEDGLADPITVEARPEYSQEYSQGHLEHLDSRELLAGYAE